MKLLSLFDGSGAFVLAAERYGITERYASEIEPFPIAVTRRCFPSEDFIFWENVFSLLCKKKTRKQLTKWLKNSYFDGACYKMAGNGEVVACV